MNRIAFLVCLALAAAGTAVAPFLILGAPTEVTMGFVQRIFYYHVPCAWVTFLSAYLCAAGSAAYLFKQSKWGPAVVSNLINADLVRDIEEKFIPDELQRDYETTFGHSPALEGKQS